MVICANKKMKKELVDKWFNDYMGFDVGKVLALVAVAFMTYSIVSPVFNSFGDGSFSNPATLNRNIVFTLFCSLVEFVTAGIYFFGINKLLDIVKSAVVNNRVCEEIEIKDNYLFYTYRKKFRFNRASQMIAIDLSRINSIEYNKSLNKISISAKMVGYKDVSVYNPLIDNVEMADHTVSMYDCFSPTLLSTLESYKNISIVNE